MTEQADARVAVYIDFDNIVISRYDQVHGRASARGKLRDVDAATLAGDAGLAAKFKKAEIDVGAILDFATSFGAVVISRAYADWSVPVNSWYKQQLVDRAVDLVQLFPTVQSMKNGADIRLAVDVIEDLFRLPDLTHVVIVAGDSDYIALAQRSKRLGRYVVGIGVAGSTSASLAAACDEFEDYDALPGIDDDTEVEIDAEIDAEPEIPALIVPPAAKAKAPAKKAAASTPPPAGPTKATIPNPQRQASKLLVRALRLGHAKEDQEWLHSPTVKNQMLRMDPTFSEKALGYTSFTNFVKSRGNIAELDDTTAVRKLRLRPGFESKP